MGLLEGGKLGVDWSQLPWRAAGRRRWRGSDGGRDSRGLPLEMAEEPMGLPPCGLLPTARVPLTGGSRKEVQLHVCWPEIEAGPFPWTRRKSWLGD